MCDLGDSKDPRMTSHKGLLQNMVLSGHGALSGGVGAAVFFGQGIPGIPCQFFPIPP